MIPAEVQFHRAPPRKPFLVRKLTSSCLNLNFQHLQIQRLSRCISSQPNLLTLSPLSLCEVPPLNLSRLVNLFYLTFPQPGSITFFNPICHFELWSLPFISFTSFTSNQDLC